MNIIVTGASSGLGAALKRELELAGHSVHDWSLETGVNITDYCSVVLACENLGVMIDCLINCAGVNEINMIEDTSLAVWDRVMDTNARGIFYCARELIKGGHLRGGTIVNIVSNASHVPMTSSIAYNASKAAAAIMTKQMARELGPRYGTTVFAVSPNKMSGTGMSEYIDKRVCDVRGWTPEQAKAYQLAALPAREETPPELVAEFIAFLLSSKHRHKFLAGCDIPYGA
jgi:NAD(P)-dependent dehydrogenase (short-subunit alcohol dehydrogenase family)